MKIVNVDRCTLMSEFKKCSARRTWTCPAQGYQGVSIIRYQYYLRSVLHITGSCAPQPPQPSQQPGAGDQQKLKIWILKVYYFQDYS